MATIRNPIEWGLAQLKQANVAAESAGRSLRRTQERLHSPAPAVRQIAARELLDVLARGLDDFGAFRADVVFLCVVYPVAGLVMARLAFGHDLLPLLFPLASGFALIGPFAAIGLYELSRRREQGEEIGWADAFAVTRSPGFGSAVLMGLVLMAIFLLWLVAAATIYDLTLGPEPPASLGAFIDAVFTTPAGWTLIGVGCSVGFLFAVLVLAISVVSFPLILDREAGIDTAIATSLRAVALNPGPMALWGAIVAGGLVLGSLPAFLGLVIIMPVLGHATWHLYRKVVAPA